MIRAKKSGSLEMRFITRAQDNLWRVWITYGFLDLGQVYFSDRKHGGKRASLGAAKQYRDQMVQQHAIPLRKHEGNGYNVRGINNVFGTVGVTLGVVDPDQRQTNPDCPLDSPLRLRGRVAQGGRIP